MDLKLFNRVKQVSWQKCSSNLNVNFKFDAVFFPPGFFQLIDDINEQDTKSWWEQCLRGKEIEWNFCIFLGCSGSNWKTEWRSEEISVKMPSQPSKPFSPGSVAQWYRSWQTKEVKEKSMLRLQEVRLRCLQFCGAGGEN